MNEKMNLLSLPDELLLRVVEYVDDHKVRPSNSRNTHYPQFNTPTSPLLPFMLSCHRLSAIAQMELYKQLSVQFRSKSARWYPNPLPLGYGLINSTLQQNPHLYACIHNLKISLSRPVIDEQETLTQLLDVLHKSLNVRTLQVWCDRDTSTCSFALQNLKTKKLQSLQIDSVAIEDLTTPGILPDLKDLEIRYIATWLNKDRAPWGEEYKLPKERRGISPLEFLRIKWWGGFGCHPCSLIPVLSWVKALRRLYIDFSVDVNYELENFPISRLQRILNIHSTKLRDIRLRAHARPSNGAAIPNFRHFTRLEKLMLSFTGLFNTEPEDAASQLAAPCLQLLTVDFDWESSQEQCYESFTDTHVSWFTRFGAAYKTLMDTRGKLRQIKIINFEYEDWEEQKVLKAARTAMRPYQIHFRWVKPDYRWKVWETEDEDEDEDEVGVAERVETELPDDQEGRVK